MAALFSDDDRIQLAFLRDEEVDALATAEHLPEDARLTAALEAPLKFSFPGVDLHITPGPYYPVLSEFGGFFRIENLQLGRVPCDTLRAKLLSVYDEALQTNTMSMWNSREELDPYGIFVRTMLVLELVSATREFLKKHDESEKERLPAHYRQPLATRGKKDEIQTKAVGSIKSSSELARDLIGNPDKIVQGIPTHMRVLHVEEILRTDLAGKFHVARDVLLRSMLQMSAKSLSRFLPPRDTARRRAGDARDKILTPRLTFHGTRRANIPHIVRHGFLKPGEALPGVTKKKTAEIHQVQQGSTYGQGIYSSPNAQFALDYSEYCCGPTPADEYFGLKLVVCATLMGRFKKVDRSLNLWEETNVLSGYDSHIANRDLEYVVFDPAHILPVYVIHLDWGENNKMHYIPQDPNQWINRTSAKMRVGDSEPTMAGASRMTPGDRQRAKEEVMAKARNWFPHGFGPKTNGDFVVEDVAVVSDDEEDYGDYQALRMDEETTVGNTEYWSWMKAAATESREDAWRGGVDSHDEYTQQRALRPHEPNWESIPLPGEARPVEEEEEEGLGIGQLLFGERDED